MLLKDQDLEKQAGPAAEEREELSIDQLDDVAGGGCGFHSGKAPFRTSYKCDNCGNVWSVPVGQTLTTCDLCGGHMTQISKF